MNRLQGFDYTTHKLAGLEVEVAQCGTGRPILFLGPSQGIWGGEAFLGLLASTGRLIVPTHPGFGYQDMPADISRLEDYVYLYLDLIDALGLDEILLVGSSLGGWMAVEMAVRNRARLCAVVLIDSLGFKFSGREERDIVDMHGIPGAELRPLLYHDPERFAPRYNTFEDDEVLRAARAWESFAFIGWQPYMHNPKLHRRLHRLALPCQVIWGERDGIVTPDYGRRIADRIPGADFALIERAAHLPHVEQADMTFERLQQFVSSRVDV